jgi:uracil phosphoribosyltransferase
MLMAYEISKTLNYATTSVQTPLGTADVQESTDQIVLLTILRAGLPMHNGILHMLDLADSAFVAAYRSHHKDGTFEIKLQYVTCPDLTDKVLIISDPMIATGASISKTIEAISEHGTPDKIHIATAISSTQGIEHVTRYHDNVEIWAGAMDDELTAKSYIVPGLGDAGDLAYGPKLQD